MTHFEKYRFVAEVTFKVGCFRSEFAGASRGVPPWLSTSALPWIHWEGGCSTPKHSVE